MAHYGKRDLDRLDTIAMYRRMQAESAHRERLGAIKTLYQARDAELLVKVHCLCCSHERQMHPMHIIQRQKKYRDIALNQPTTLFLCKCGMKYADVRVVGMAQLH
jgi:hypothetical protein